MKQIKWMLIIILAALVTALIGSWLFIPKQMPASEKQALIGGSFNLINQDGKEVSDKDFKGTKMLVYFGFANCPDICPVDLATITESLEILEEDADKIQPLFITIDPERDTPAALKTYMENFYPSFQALTGSKEQIDQAVQAYKVYSQKDENAQLAGYSMNHSGYIYFMDEDGKYISHFNHATPAKEMADKIKNYL